MLFVISVKSLSMHWRLRGDVEVVRAVSWIIIILRWRAPAPSHRDKLTISCSLKFHAKHYLSLDLITRCCKEWSTVIQLDVSQRSSLQEVSAKGSGSLRNQSRQWQAISDTFLSSSGNNLQVRALWFWLESRELHCYQFLTRVFLKQRGLSIAGCQTTN